VERVSGSIPDVGFVEDGAAEPPTEEPAELE